MTGPHRLPKGQRRPCACGCGGLTNSRWVQGHDGLALRAALQQLGCVDPDNGPLAAFIWAVRAGRIKRVDK